MHLSTLFGIFAALLHSEISTASAPSGKRHGIPTVKTASNETPCDSMCVRRLFYQTAYSAAAQAASETMTAYDSLGWCLDDARDWCPGVINNTLSAIAGQAATTMSVDFDNCGDECLLKSLSTISNNAAYAAMFWANSTVSGPVEEIDIVGDMCHNKPNCTVEASENGTTKYNATKPVLSHKVETEKLRWTMWQLSRQQNQKVDIDSAKLSRLMHEAAQRDDTSETSVFGEAALNSESSSTQSNSGNAHASDDEGGKARPGNQPQGDSGSGVHSGSQHGNSNPGPNTHPASHSQHGNQHGDGNNDHHHHGKALAIGLPFLASAPLLLAPLAVSGLKSADPILGAPKTFGYLKDLFQVSSEVLSPSNYLSFLTDSGGESTPALAGLNYADWRAQEKNPFGKIQSPPVEWVPESPILEAGNPLEVDDDDVSRGGDDSSLQGIPPSPLEEAPPNEGELQEDDSSTKGLRPSPGEEFPPFEQAPPLESKPGFTPQYYRAENFDPRSGILVQETLLRAPPKYHDHSNFRPLQFDEKGKARKGTKKYKARKSQIIRQGYKPFYKLDEEGKIIENWFKGTNDEGKFEWKKMPELTWNRPADLRPLRGDWRTVGEDLMQFENGLPVLSSQGEPIYRSTETGLMETAEPIAPVGKKVRIKSDYDFRVYSVAEPCGTYKEKGVETLKGLYGLPDPPKSSSESDAESSPESDSPGTEEVVGSEGGDVLDDSASENSFYPDDFGESVEDSDYDPEDDLSMPESPLDDGDDDGSEPWPNNRPWTTATRPRPLASPLPEAPDEGRNQDHPTHGPKNSQLGTPTARPPRPSMHDTPHELHTPLAPPTARLPSFTGHVLPDGGFEPDSSVIRSKNRPQATHTTHPPPVTVTTTRLLVSTTTKTSSITSSPYSNATVLSAKPVHLITSTITVTVDPVPPPEKPPTYKWEKWADYAGLPYACSTFYPKKKHPKWCKKFWGQILQEDSPVWSQPCRLPLWWVLPAELRPQPDADLAIMCPALIPTNSTRTLHGDGEMDIIKRPKMYW